MLLCHRFELFSYISKVKIILVLLSKRFDCSSIVHSLGPDNKIYVGAANDLYAIAQDGSVLWSFPTGNGIWSSPAIGSDGTIYINSMDTKLYAIQSSSKWADKNNADMMEVYANSR
jgi:outer membrane protein assembly factor BamB